MTVFDFETTGLSKYDRIVQIAATPTSAGMVVDHDNEYYSLVHPGYVKKDGKEEMFEVDKGASAIHGIYPEDLADQPLMEEILQDLTRDVIKPRGLLVAYNAKFDVGMLNHAIDRWNGSPLLRREYGPVKELDLALAVDPFVLIQRIHPYVSMKKTLGNHFRILMGTDLENMHDAQADVEATIDVLKYITKYMEKHYIPQEWGKAAEKILTKDVFTGKRAAEWHAMDRAGKAGFIARFVSENRETFEAQFGKPEATPIRPIDLLRFQHGYMTFHDERGNLPVFDFTLNILGVDAKKEWDGSDTLDAEIADEVRVERDAENRAFLLARFKANFPKNAVTTAAESLRPKLKPGAATVKREAAALGTAVIENVGEEIFVRRMFEGALPNPNSETYKQDQAALRKELAQAFTQSVQASMGDKTPLDAKEQSAVVKTLVEQGLTTAEHLQAELGHRFFYQYGPVDDTKLIDEAVLKAVAKAGTKRVLGNKAASVTSSGSNVTALPQPRTLALA